MFAKKEPTKPATADEFNALLGRGSEFEGKLAFSGTVRLDGKFTGQVFSEGFLIIGEEAVVKGDIRVDTAIVSGQVEGNITARSRVELRGPARLSGDVATPVFVVEEGVTFDGHCQMTGGKAKKHMTLIEGQSQEKLTEAK
ncbi:MAG: polymer-forming cytoskeletal protein [Nitrospirae bacterium]|nr:polymer-forming cytoskeletal protein [Nitrospirota bacterium]